MEFLKSLAITFTKWVVLVSIFVFTIGILAICQLPYSMWYAKVALSIWTVVGVKIVGMILLGTLGSTLDQRSKA